MPWTFDRLSAIRRPVVRKALRKQKLTTLEQVWTEIGRQDDALDKLAESTGADRATLVRDLLDSTSREADLKERSWLRRHGLDLIVLSLLALLGALVALALPRSQPPEARQERFRITLPLAPEETQRFPALPGEASFAVVSRTGKPPAVFFRDVLVLRTEGASVTAAFTPEELERLLPLLPYGQIRVVQPGTEPHSPPE
jgi:hypothetical protein